MSAADTVLDRLHGYKVHQNGPDRWRAVCPVCGVRNPNTLSVGVRNDGAVLIKCFKSACDVESITAALGLTVTDLFPPKESSGSPLKRRRMITAQQALDQLDEEAQFVGMVAANIGHGVELSAADRERCITAAGRIGYLKAESRS